MFWGKILTLKDITVFKVFYDEGLENLFWVDIRRDGVMQRLEVETTKDGDIMPAGEVSEDVDAAIRAVLGLFVG